VSVVAAAPQDISRGLSRSRLLQWLALFVMVAVMGPALTRAQTPSPLTEWQYSAGIPLEELFEPTRPQWRVVLGAAAAVQPVYSGARAYRVLGGPVINIRYKDLAFVSLGEGLGVNIARGEQYHVGIALGYDLGRRVSQDRVNLRGLGNISVAPSVKLFGSWVVSKAFPLVIQADVRQIVGGADGALGDLEFYLPLPGCSERFMMFFGPSITWADHRYLQTEFGITPTQSLESGHPVFRVHSGTNSVGLGLSMTRFITNHWLINLDGAISHLRGSAADSPVTETRVQRTLAASFAYRW
jgi:outer membrane scaffolding protein for murein synthesis (MipA/OmpV family)